MTYVAVLTDNKTLPQNLLLSAGSLVEDMETIGDWTATEGSVADDSVNYKTGSHSIAITSASGASGRAHKTVSLDLSNCGRGMIYTRRTASQGDAPSIYFYDNADESKYLRYKMLYTTQPGLGWDVMHFHRLGMLDDGTAPNDASIVRFRCRHVAPSGQVRVANFDSFYLGLAGVPAIYIQFEDARANHGTAADYMAAHRMRSNISIVSDLTAGSDPERLHWSDLIALEAAGHCVLNATRDHTSLGTLTEAQQEAELTDCRDAGIAAGIWSGANANNWRYMSYPSGSYSADTLTAFDAVGMRLGFNYISTDGLFGMPFGQVYMLPFKHLSLATSLETITGLIDAAIARGQLLMFYVEDFGNTSISIDTFYDVIDYCATKRDQLYCVTADDLYKLQSGAVSVPRIR